MGAGEGRGDGDELPPMMAPGEGLWAASAGFRPIRIPGPKVTIRDDIPQPIDPEPFSGVRRPTMARPDVPEVPIGPLHGYISRAPLRVPVALNCVIPGCRARLADPREMFEHWVAHHPNRHRVHHITKALPRPPR